MKTEELLAKYTEIIDAELSKLLLRARPATLYEPIKYHLFAGGKRVRPVLCMLACEAVSGSYEKAMPIALAFEFTHAYTLVHDDIMDKDDLRRGKPTVWKKFGEALAINAGDGIFAKAFESALNLDVEPRAKEKILRAYINAVIDTCEGQALDVSFENRWDVLEKEYIEMSNKKTASLIATALECGAIAGNGSEEECAALRKYGEKLGLAFQIWDDYIDFASEKTGKTFGLDIKRGKKTSVMCHALKNSNALQKRQLMRILEDGVITDDEIPDVVRILKETGSVAYAKGYAQKLVREAKEALAALKPSEAKHSLHDFADFVVRREY